MGNFVVKDPGTNKKVSLKFRFVSEFSSTSYHWKEFAIQPVINVYRNKYCQKLYNAQILCSFTTLGLYLK